jgi:aspartyl protease family protein
MFFAAACCDRGQSHCGGIMGQIVTFALVLLVAGVLAVKFVDQNGRAPTAAAATAAPAQAATNYRSVSLNRADNGHFEVEARVDGRRLDFLVDTGASHIALRESDAARLGIRPIPRDYTAKVSTANGVVAAARVELRSVEIGGIVVRDLSAIVLPDEALGANLLGMSFLSRVRWTHERGKLVLEQ